MQHFSPLTCHCCGRTARLVVMILALLPLGNAGATLAGEAEGAASTAGDVGSAPELPAAPDSYLPMLLGLQYTYILQRQSALHSPYSGPLSLRPHGDTQPTNTIGLYGGWAPLNWGQVYLDVEKFMGAGVSNAAGLGGLANGDVIRGGVAGLRKQFYIARLYARFMLPLSSAVNTVEHAQDQIPGTEPATRLELKIGRLAVPDDFDQNRYGNSPRTQFMNWALMNDTAWDYAANTRGYSDGIMLGYFSPRFSVNYGIYRMPAAANAQALVPSLFRASGQNLQLTFSGLPTGTVVRLLGYLNTAAMGNYDEALAIAAAHHTVPDVAATDQPGRHKHGFGLDAEQPLADDGDTGMFVRWGWNDGREESFVFTEVDRTVSAGLQISGREWRQPGAQLGMGVAFDSLSAPHRDYLAAGGSGFVLGDGRLRYGPEQIIEIYYRLQRIWPEDPGPVHWQLGPDFQFVRNPGYNRDRGPVTFWGLRLHMQY